MKAPIKTEITKTQRLRLDREKYRQAKARANRIKIKGDGFEDLIIMRFLLNAAVLSRTGNRGMAWATARRANDEFVDDITLSYPCIGETRFTHAKSGATSGWDENLERDFQEQVLEIKDKTGCSMDLWVGSQERRLHFRATAPRDLPEIGYRVLQSRLLQEARWRVPFVARYLRKLVNAVPDEQLLRSAWIHLCAAWQSMRDDEADFHQATAYEVMDEAHRLSCGAIRTLNPTNPDLLSFVVSVRKIKGLSVSADGETLIYWSDELHGRVGCAPVKIKWKWLEERVEKIGAPKTKSAFLRIIGAR